MKRILFLSTHNFATNPRLVKEIELALENNFAVSVICFSFNNWSRANNDIIKQRLKQKITYYEVPGNRWPPIPWLLSSASFSLSKIFLKLYPVNTFLLSLFSNKRSLLLLQKARHLKEEIGLVVAHNPGSFYPAQKMAQERNIPLGIDLEDYHPGETTNPITAGYLRSLLAGILPAAAYISAASPLILDKSISDTGGINSQPITIMNYFPGSEFIKPKVKTSGKLLMVWFSQNISYNRGLEQLIPCIKHNHEVELHLFGNASAEFVNEWLMDLPNLFLHDALPQDELHQRLSAFDIGLAIEPGKDMNNELALSNKILAYYQAGLYILASDTNAQNKFISDNGEHGISTSLHDGMLSGAINQLVAAKDRIRKTAIPRFDTASTTSWETESTKLLNSWHMLFK